MEQVFKILKELEQINSTKDKELLLKANLNKSELKLLLERALNPYRHYQFNTSPFIYKECKSDNISTNYTNYHNFIRLLDNLEERKFTGNAAKEEVYKVFCRFTEKEFIVYSKILIKDTIGVGAKTVNKVWPELIPEFAVMLAPNKIADITNIKYPCYVQPKLDGYRCIYKKGALWSRTGRPFGNKNLIKYFGKLLNSTSYVLDGELYAHGLNFGELQTILNTENAQIPTGLKYFVYDCISNFEWENKNCKKSYEERLSDIRSVLNGVISDYTKIIDTSTDLVRTSKEVVELYKNYLNKGYEGVMIKDVDGKYKWKRVTLRSGEMIKLKPFKSLDLEVISIYDGEGKFQGMAGGVVVDYNGVSVNCGSGFDDAMRKKMAEEPEQFVGKMVEIKYFEETPDGSLRSPIFQRWREDKE